MRYLTKELFMYFFVAFLFFFMIFFVNQILYWAETILKQRAPAHQVAKLMLYALPGVISQSAPFATLVGFLMCLGRLMTDNEILILRA
ncbi:MAG: LptF/LptG family permease, partial [Treponema sp.]|nr:LptF/LptG family permease [Treponema sp.]